MTRPLSIISFERLYVAAFILGVISTVQTWGVQTAMLGNDPRLTSMPWLPYAGVALRVVVAGALWYLVARRGSVVAKWIVVVLAAYGAVLLALLLLGLVQGSASLAIVGPSALQNILYLAAAAMLFRPDTRRWFGEDTSAETMA